MYTAELATDEKGRRICSICKDLLSKEEAALGYEYCSLCIKKIDEAELEIDYDEDQE